MNAALAFTLLVLFISLGLFLRLRNGMRQLQLLGGFSPILPDSAPRVSIIFSALNEALTIEPALRSMLALDYPDLEIIAINDRSYDATGAILDRLGQEHPILRVLHIRELVVEPHNISNQTGHTRRFAETEWMESPLPALLAFISRSNIICVFARHCVDHCARWHQLARHALLFVRTKARPNLTNM